MNFQTVIARLNDLPRTFKRTGAPYTQIIDAIGVQLTEFTDAADATAQQVQMDDNAVDGWLDVWGLLWGVPRNPNEANSTYHLRIDRTVLAWVGTLPALRAWVAFYASGGTVTENFPAVGYSIQLPGGMTSTQVIEFIESLNRIRPAGVPFTVTQIGGGIFLGTEAFLNTGGFEGAYLAAGTEDIPLPIGPSTPSAVPLLPTLLFSAAILNV